MPADVIQVEYERLSEVAAGFGRNADAAAALQGQVQRSAQALRQGGWEGRGFAAFCAEMDGVVLPVMRRLHAALGQAQTVTLKIAEVARQAEEEAAQPFKARDQVTIPLGSVAAGGVAAGVLGVASVGAGQTGLFAPTTDGSSKLTASLMADVDGDCDSGISGLFCRIGRAIGDFFRSIFGGGSAELDPATPTGRTSVPPSEADAIFRDMADESDIPFRFPADGCYARSHLMVMRMAERYGLNLDSMQKVIIEGNLTITTTYTYPEWNDTTVRWRYHIAPLLNVHNPDGTTTPMVIDPSLFDRPATIDEWSRYMNDPDATPQIVDRHVYAPGYSLEDDAANRDAQRTLEVYLKYCKEAGYCQ